jgi:hypothetical protein
MPQQPDLTQLLANNPNIDAEKLKTRLKMRQKRTGGKRSRYRYNLLAPFAGRRTTAAKARGASSDK